MTFPLLPVAPLPQVDFPTISVSAQLPGASPDTMAATVAAPLERQFGQIAGVTQMTSTSTLGSTSITLQFELTRNVDAAAQDVQAAITAAGRQLPQTLTTPPTYRKVNPADSPILVLAAHSDTLPLTTVDDFADNVVAQQISQITGVAQVIIGGEQKPAIRVQVDPGQAADARPDAGRRARRARQRHHQRRERHDQHRATELHHPGERPGDQGRAV